jgi:hypothetical protein
MKTIENIRLRAELLGKTDEFEKDIDAAFQMGFYFKGLDWIISKWSKI